MCQPATLLKEFHRCFPVNFAKFLGTPFFTEHLWWLLLYSLITCFSARENMDKPDQVLFRSSFLTCFIN